MKDTILVQQIEITGTFSLMKNAIVNPSEAYLCLLYALHWPYCGLLEYGIGEYLR